MDKYLHTADGELKLQRKKNHFIKGDKVRDKANKYVIGVVVDSNPSSSAMYIDTEPQGTRTAVFKHDYELIDDSLNP